MKNEQVCTLAVAMPEGDVYVAPLLFWGDSDNLRMYMCTSRTSEKMWWLQSGRTSVRAALAIGLAKSLPYSLQMRGRLEVFDPLSDPSAGAQYRLIASDLNNPDDPANAMIVFIPEWARYTDRAHDYTKHQIALA